MVFPLVCEVYCFRVLHPSFLPKNSAGFLVEGFCWLNHTKNGFPLLKETCAKYKKLEKCPRISRVLTGFPGFNCISRGFHAISRGFHPIYWVFTTFCRVCCAAYYCAQQGSEVKLMCPDPKHQICIHVIKCFEQPLYRFPLTLEL